jgi:hypothetical protein
MAMRDFWYYGLLLATDLPLEGLPHWPAKTRAPDLVIACGFTPERLVDPVTSTRFLSIEAGGAMLVTFEGLFRLLFVDAVSAIIETLPGAPMVEIESHLLSYIAGLVLHRRGATPLHASCVAIDGRAIAICGDSGLGKSTLAAALAREGHAVLSDDITVVQFAVGTALAVPGSPHVRLNEDSIRATALDATELAEGRLTDDKKIWRRQATAFEPLPLAAVFRLERASEGEAAPSIRRARGPAAVLPLQEMIYRFGLGRRLGRAADLAYAALRLAGHTPIYRLRRASSLDALGVTRDMILGQL